MNKHTDEEYAKLAQQGDNDSLEYLIKKYNGLLVRVATNCRNGPMELEDLVQEGRIGLYRAIMSYSDKVDCSFKTFFYLCAKRQITCAIRMATRQKHMPLNKHIPLKYDREDNGIDVSDTKLRPDEIMEVKELVNMVRDVIDKKLSWIEGNAMKLRLMGYKYKDVAKKMKIGENRINKAIDRGKKKLRKLLKGKI